MRPYARLLGAAASLVVFGFGNAAPTKARGDRITARSPRNSIASGVTRPIPARVAATFIATPSAGKRASNTADAKPGPVRSAADPGSAPPIQAPASPEKHKPADLNSAIQHIVFIIKENRTFDQIFGTFPGADGTTVGAISTGQVIPLGHAPDRGPRDVNHTYPDATTAVDNGKMDQFDLINDKSSQCSVNGDYLCMTQYVQEDIPNYFSYATTFTLGDHMYSSIKSSSMPNHLYTIAAQSGGVINSVNGQPISWGCDAPPGTTVPVIDAEGNLTNQFPCFDFQTLADLLENIGVSWRSYAKTGNDWNAYDAINHIRNT